MDMLTLPIPPVLTTPKHSNMEDDEGLDCAGISLQNEVEVRDTETIEPTVDSQAMVEASNTTANDDDATSDNANNERVSDVNQNVNVGKNEVMETEVLPLEAAVSSTQADVREAKTENRVVCHPLVHVNGQLQHGFHHVHPLPCPMCGEYFETWPSVRVHLEASHRKFQCEICRRLVSHKRNLDRHRRSGKQTYYFRNFLLKNRMNSEIHLLMI